MKGSKKIMGLAMAAFIAAGSMPGGVIYAEDYESFSVVKVKEDFEGYETGIIAQGAGSFSFGDWSIDLLDNDKVEIAQEEGGNKYLKITRGNTSNSNTTVAYNFSEKSGMEIMVTYDFLPEVNSKNFDQFGSLAKADGTIVNRIFSFGSDLYESGFSNYKGGVVNKANYSGYVNISQTVDINGSNSTYKFYSVGLDPDGSARIRENAERTITADSIGKIVWAIRQQNDASWNGPDKNDDCSNAGIYRIDNLTLSVKTLPIIAKTNITDGETNVRCVKDFVVTFDKAVSDNAAESATVSNTSGELIKGTDYNVVLSEDKKVMTISPVGKWKENSTYTVTINKINGDAENTMFNGATMRFSTGTDIYDFPTVEDFESYDTGIIAEDEGTYSFGALDFVLLDGDKAEIAQEENGNKYLKITRGNTSSSNTTISYFFNKQTSGKMTVSYDFLPEVHSMYFDQMGALAQADGTIVNVIHSAGSDLYENGWTNHIEGVVNKSNYNGYVNIQQTVDFSGDSPTCKFYSSGMDNDNNIIVKEAKEHTIAAANIANIVWKLMYNASNTGLNGSDSGSGVYRIDNLTVAPYVSRINAETNITDGEINVRCVRDLTVTFDNAVSDNAAESVTVSDASGELIKDTDYNVVLSEDKKVMTISPVGKWKENSTYTVTINKINGDAENTMFNGATMGFSTGTDVYGFPTVEDFESYDTGIIAEGAGTYSFGAWDFVLLDGDKAEIAQEENGNKYLKITRGSTSKSNTSVSYYFNKQTSGKMMVSYDFLPEVNSKNFDQFGSLAKADDSIVNRIFSFGSDLYESGFSNFKGGVVNKANYSGYVNIKQTVDINGSNSTYKFYSVGLDPDGNGRVRENAERTITADNIAKIVWAVRQQEDAGWNGPDQNEDCSNAGVYRIDNLVVEGEIYTSDAESGISTDGTKSVISAKLCNDTINPITYQAIGVLKNTDGKIISITSGSAGTLEKGGVCDISVESTVDSEAVSYELYIWNSLNGMRALTKKITLNSVNQ